MLQGLVFGFFRGGSWQGLKIGDSGGLMPDLCLVAFFLLFSLMWMVWYVLQSSDNFAVLGVYDVGALCPNLDLKQGLCLTFGPPAATFITSRRLPCIGGRGKDLLAYCVYLPLHSLGRRQAEIDGSAGQAAITAIKPGQAREAGRVDPLQRLGLCLRLAVHRCHSNRCRDDRRKRGGLEGRRDISASCACDSASGDGRAATSASVRNDDTVEC